VAYLDDLREPSADHPFFHLARIEDAAFNEHLAALNDDYRRYLAINARVREEAEREVGDRLEEASAKGP